MSVSEICILIFFVSLTFYWFVRAFLVLFDIVAKVNANKNTNSIHGYKAAQSSECVTGVNELPKDIAEYLKANKCCFTHTCSQCPYATDDGDCKPSLKGATYELCERYGVNN